MEGAVDHLHVRIDEVERECQVGDTGSVYCSRANDRTDRQPAAAILALHLLIERGDGSERPKESGTLGQKRRVEHNAEEVAAPRHLGGGADDHIAGESPLLGRISELGRNQIMARSEAMTAGEQLVHAGERWLERALSTDRRVARSAGEGPLLSFGCACNDDAKRGNSLDEAHALPFRG